MKAITFRYSKIHYADSKVQVLHLSLNVPWFLHSSISLPQVSSFSSNLAFPQTMTSDLRSE